MGILDRIKLKFAYNMVGRDIYGNEYYESKKCDMKNKFKRAVKYKGVVESTKIPPMWHAWIHGIKESVPSISDSKIENWQREHIPNLTGTQELNDNINKPLSHFSAWKIIGREADNEQ